MDKKYENARNLIGFLSHAMDVIEMAEFEDYDPSHYAELAIKALKELKPEFRSHVKLK